MSVFHKSCALACLLSLGCGGKESAGSDPYTGGDGTDTTTDPVDMDDAGNGGGNGGQSGGQTGGQNANGGTDAGATGGIKDAGTKPDAGMPDAGPKPMGGVNFGPPALAASCNGMVKPGVTGALPSFKRETLSTQPGSAYMHPVDMNRDGFPEYLLSSLAEGPDALGAAFGGSPVDFGGGYVFRREGGAPKAGELGKWQTQKVFDKADKIACPNSSELFDVDGDGVNDWVLGAGFLLKNIGKLVWMKGTAAGAFGKPQTIIEPADKCWYHVALPVDMDGDGDNDFVSSCHIGDITTAATGASRIEWFENDGKGKFTVRQVGSGGGALISLRDLDGDGDQDVVAPQFWGPEAMVWYEQTGEKGSAWTKHLINDTTGRGFIVKFADMNGDGKTDMLYGNHNHQAAADAADKVMGIYWFDLPETDKVRDLANWDAYKHTIYEGFQVNNTDPARASAPGMLNVGDIDGDCDMDVTVSGDGDLGLYVLVQQADKFDLVTLYTDASNENSGEQNMADINGDGKMDIVWPVFGPAGIGAIAGFNSHIYGFVQN